MARGFSRVNEDLSLHNMRTSLDIPPKSRKLQLQRTSSTIKKSSFTATDPTHKIYFNVEGILKIVLQNDIQKNVLLFSIDARRVSEMLSQKLLNQSPHHQAEGKCLGLMKTNISS